MDVALLIAINAIWRPSGEIAKLLGWVVGGVEISRRVSGAATGDRSHQTPPPTPALAITSAPIHCNCARRRDCGEVRGVVVAVAAPGAQTCAASSCKTYRTVEISGS